MSIRKVGDRHEVRYRDAEGREHSRRFPNLKQAEAFERDQRAAVAAGRHIAPSAGRVRLSAYSTEWLDLQAGRWRPGTIRGNASRTQNHIEPHLGDLALSRIRPSTIQRWVDTLSATLSPATVRVSHGLLKAMLTDAVRDGLVGSNPCNGSKLPKVPRRPVQVFTPAQVRGLADAIVPELSAAVVLAASSGLRQAELFGLTVDRVDFLRREITVDRQLLPGKGPAAKWGPPKSDEGRRTVPVPASALEPVAAYLAECPANSDGLLFSRPDRSPWRHEYARREIKPALRSIGADGPWVGWHVLRHTYASALISAGVDVVEVSRRLGHAQVSVTLNTYSHLFASDDGQRTRDALDQWFASG